MQPKHSLKTKLRVRPGRERRPVDFLGHGTAFALVRPRVVELDEVALKIHIVETAWPYVCKSRPPDDDDMRAIIGCSLKTVRRARAKLARWDKSVRERDKSVREVDKNVQPGRAAAGQERPRDAAQRAGQERVPARVKEAGATAEPNKETDNNKKCAVVVPWPDFWEEVLRGVNNLDAWKQNIVRTLALRKERGQAGVSPAQADKLAECLDALRRPRGAGRTDLSNIANPEVRAEWGLDYQVRIVAKGHATVESVLRDHPEISREEFERRVAEARASYLERGEKA
jgi:hypothetical protein